MITPTTPRAGLALGLLLAINLFNFIDRQVLSAVLPKLELEAGLFDPADKNIKKKLGALTTAFLVTYMLIAPVFGRIGDKRSRWVLIGMGVIAWSLASGGSGLAASFLVLLLTRCLVGIGEAAYGPVAPAMISDLYPEQRRGKALSFFYIAIPVGSALGFVIGGTVAEEWGWRAAFQVVVLPGLILGVLCFFMKEPPRRVAKADAPARDWRAILMELKGIRSFVLCCAGMTCSTFVLGGVAAWAPYYIFEREARFQVSPEALRNIAESTNNDGVPFVPPDVVNKLRPLISPAVMTSAEFKAELAAKLALEEQRQYQSRIIEKAIAPNSITLGRIDLMFGTIVVVSGLLATLFGGWLGDKLRTRIPGAYFQVSGYGVLLGFPPFLGMLFAPFPLAWVFVFLTVFCLFANTGPANTILANVTRPQIRASAFAINILIIHLLGDAISPPLIGWIADESSLQRALELVSVFVIAAGVLWVMGARYLDAETKRVSDSEAAG